MANIPVNKDEIFYRLALSEVDHVGVKTAKKLINHFGSSQEVFNLSTRELMQVQGMVLHRAVSISTFAGWERVEKELNYAEDNNIEVVSFTEKNYPNRLKHCEDGPLVLFKKGAADLSAGRMLSIVGTRRITEYGRAMTRKLVESLVPYNVTVVSGLAYGVDIEAHKACIDFGVPTIGVLGHGLDKIYPSSHTRVANDMVSGSGALLTEFLTGTKPDRENFPQRNRIVAGMCDATLVIESASRGGSMITAELANNYHRDVFAIPGRVGDKRSEGCNKLIKGHKAALFESVKDLEYIMGWTLPQESKPIQRKIFVDLSPEEETILAFLREKGKIQIDELSLQLKVPVSMSMVHLLNLELSGLVRSLPGKIYEAS
ncbi:MAG: DNA-processing protein DprA [Flavobacteriales bacterium]|nr:DNA-processing protein DprA [Flavobacteriales bacterium]